MQFPRIADSPQKLQREKTETRRMVGRSCLRLYCTARILIPHHHPKSGLRHACPFQVQDAPPCSARHETAAWSPKQLKPCCKQKEGFRRKGGAGNLWARFEMNQTLCQGRGKAQFHTNSCIRTEPTQQHLGMGKKVWSFLCLGKRNQHTEHKPFRVGSEWAVSTPRRCQAAPHWALFGTAGEPTSSPHPIGAIHGRTLLPWHGGITPMTLSCMQNGPAVMSQGRAAAFWIESELFPPALYLTCTHTSSSHQGPSLCRVQGQRAG